MRLPRLTYFDMRGRSEAIRLVLHATDTRFHDHRLVAADEWKALRPRLPFERLPIYQTPTQHLLCESQAILRYVGRALAPARDDLNRAEVDAAQDAIAESQEDLWRFNWTEGYYERLEPYARSTLLPRLGHLEAWLISDDREWFGGAFSHADCLAFCYLDEIDAFFPAILARFPRLADLRRRVASLPGISSYLASSARPAVFGLGIMGPKVDPRVAPAPGSRWPNPWSEPIDLGRIARRQRRLTESS